MWKHPTALEKRLTAYAVSAGVALAVAPSPDAQVVYVDLDPDLCTSLGTAMIDFDGDSADDLEVVHSYYSAYGLRGDLNFAPGGSFVAQSTRGYYARALGASDTISSQQTFGTGGKNAASYALFSTFYSIGDWNNGNSAFVGFRFLAGGATNHYGWMRVTVPSDNSEVCVEDYAYETTPDAPIHGGAIPVELVSFYARASGNDVALNWETSSETNNAGFEVQMMQGEDWQPLGFVEGNGTTTETQTYNFTASGMDVGTHTFRLKQIDFDGAFEYSPEVEATIEVVGTHQLSNAYPNPFNPTSQFTLAVAHDQRVTAELYNVLGQRVATLFNGTIEANSSRIVQIDGSALASGAYIVRVTGETFSDTLHVTLMK